MRSTTRLAALLTAVAALTLVTTGPVAARPPSSAPVAGSNAGFGVQAARNGKPDARAALSYAATPGATVRDEVAVVNLGARPLTLAVYATDATSGASGSVTLLPATSRPKDVGTWVTVDSARSVRVPARTAAGPSHVIVPIEVAVPEGASPGDHVGGVVVALAGQARDRTGVNVTLDQRVAIPVVARVSGTIRAQLRVENLDVAWHGPSLLNGNPVARGYASVTYRVHNVGNVQLGATQSVTVDPLLGPAANARPADVPALLPGASADLRVRVDGVFPGVRLGATVSLQPIADAGTAGTAPAGVSASASTWAVPWLLLVLLVLVLVAVAYLVHRARRPRPAAAHSRSSRHRPRSSQNRTVAS